VLTKIAPGFIFLKVSAFIMPVVSDVTRGCMVTISERDSKSSNETCSTPALQVIGGKLDIGVVDDDLGAEGAQQPHHLGTDIAIADDADGHFREFAAGAVGAIEIAAPFTLAQRFVANADQARFGKDRAEREFRNRA
jgi:hypothetical protein